MLNLKKNQVRVTNFPTVCKEISADPEEFVEKLHKYPRRVLDYLLMLSTKVHLINVSQTKIAYEVGCSRAQVNRILKKFQRLGIIMKDYRYKKTCIYTVSRFFAEPEVKSKISYFFKTFRCMALSLLCSLPIFCENVTIYKNKSFIEYLFKDSNYIKTPSRRGRHMDDQVYYNQNPPTLHTKSPSPEHGSIKTLKGAPYKPWVQVDGPYHKPLSPREDAIKAYRKLLELTAKASLDPIEESLVKILTKKVTEYRESVQLTSPAEHLD